MLERLELTPPVRDCRWVTSPWQHRDEERLDYVHRVLRAVLGNSERTWHLEEERKNSPCKLMAEADSGPRRPGS